jgi:hypothetical protein
MKKNWIMLIIVTLITIIGVSSIFIILMLIPTKSELEIPVADVTIINASTSTPILRATWEPTITAEVVEAKDNDGKFKLNEYVQIIGTDGEGLRIRSGAGRSYNVNFIGMDSELFTIIDGPIKNDNYIWWQIEAPYDTARNGWCVQDYLSKVDTP